MIRRVDEKFGAGSENVSNVRSFQITNWLWLNVDVSWCLEGGKPSIAWYLSFEAWNCLIWFLDQPHSGNLLRTFSFSFFFFFFGIPLDLSLSIILKKEAAKRSQGTVPKEIHMNVNRTCSPRETSTHVKLILKKNQTFPTHRFESDWT